MSVTPEPNAHAAMRWKHVWLTIPFLPNVALVHARGVDWRGSAAIVPVGEHEALPRRAVDVVLVARRAMRVTVNHALDAVPAEGVVNGVGRDVLDRLGFERLRGRGCASAGTRR